MVKISAFILHPFLPLVHVAKMKNESDQSVIHSERYPLCEGGIIFLKKEKSHCAQSRVLLIALELLGTNE